MPSWLIGLLGVPVACGIIGWITNVIAVKMIFRPREALRLAGLTFQGVLPKHLDHFAGQLAEIITGDFMTTSEMVANLDIDKVYDQLQRRADETFDLLVDDLKGILGEGQRAMITDEVIETVHAKVHEELRGALPEIKEELCERADDLVDLTAALKQKIMEMGATHLEQVIYKIARKELKFIEYYGGVFGFLIGGIQLGVVFAIGASISWELPVIGALVGMFTNYLAIQMLFYPREMRGVGPFKLQGLFPKRQTEIAMAQAEVAAEELILVDEIFAQLKDKLIPDQVDQSMVQQIEGELTKRYPMVAGTVQAVLTSEQQEQFKELLAKRFVELTPAVADEVIDVAAKHIDIETIMADKISNLPKLRFEELLRGLFKEEELYLVIYGGLLGAVMGLLQLAALGLAR
ncbi:MAG: hypothetical protein CSA24_01315 [Deltaproteobacteria bacterium]|nr:MAG: hypothetical protein CSA24_01315 [Deltaproteobacteria bacterium]